VSSGLILAIHNGRLIDGSGGKPVEEIQLLHSGALTRMQVLVAATRDAAFAFGRQADLGRVAPGWIADLIIVAGDPLQDLEALARVARVIQGGSVLSQPMQDGGSAGS